MDEFVELMQYSHHYALPLNNDVITKQFFFTTSLKPFEQGVFSSLQG
jgi:hypothetical protein